MSASDLAAVIVAACSVVAVVLLAVGVVALLRTLRAMREVATLLRTEAAPVLDDLRDTVDAANGEIDRLDRLVTTAESVTGTVDSASRLAYIAMANPVIKGVAFASGTARAARRLRPRRDGGDTEDGGSANRTANRPDNRMADGTANGRTANGRDGR